MCHLRPLIDDEGFTLETAANTHCPLQSGGARGKVVIDLVLGAGRWRSTDGVHAAARRYCHYGGYERDNLCQ